MSKQVQPKERLRKTARIRLPLLLDWMVQTLRNFDCGGDDDLQSIAQSTADDIDMSSMEVRARTKLH